MKQFVSFILICLGVVGAIGGVGYSLFLNAWPVAAGVIALTYMAWPKFVECFRNLTK